MGISKKEMSIMLTMRNMATKELTRTQGKIKQFSKASKADFVSLAAKVYLAEKAFKVLSAAIDKTVSPLIETNSKVEDYQTQLEVLLKSEEKANQVFKDMAQFAGEVPKRYDEIMESATALSGVVKDGEEEINRLMPMIVDIASAKGMAVEEVTGQIIRMYSAGAASADMFRERGITAALGFKQGVSYTNKETMDILYKQWEDGTGKFVGASDRLAENFTGMVSMFEDNWFQFKQQVGEPMFEDLKIDMGAVLKIIKDSKEEGGKYNEVIERLSETLQDAYGVSKDFFATALVSGGQLVDIFNEINWAVKGAQAAWVGMMAGVMKVTSLLSVGIGLGKLVDKKALKGGVDAAVEDLHRLSKEIKEARDRADKDYSSGIEERIMEFKKALEVETDSLRKQQEERKALEEQTSQEISDKKKESLDEEVALYLEKEEEKVEKLREQWAIWQDEKHASTLAAYEAESEQLQFYLDTQKKAYESMWSLAGKARDTFSKGTSKALTNLITQSGSAEDALKSMGQQMVQTLIDWGVQKAVNFALSKTFLAAEVKAAQVAGTATADAWSEAAAFVSLATMGANAIPAAAGIISTVGLSQALAMPGLEHGVIDKARYGGTIVRVAEGGEDEAVIPLNSGRDRLREALGGDMGGSTVIIEKIVIQGDVTEKNVNSLAEKIGETFRQERNYVRSY